MEVRRIGPDGGFLREFTDVRKRVQHLETRPSGVISSSKYVEVKNDETGEKTYIGVLPDGGVGIQPFIYDITPPPVASTPIAVAEPGLFSISWDGTFVDGADQPSDFVAVNIIGHKIVNGTAASSIPVGRTTTAGRIYVSTDVVAVGETWEFSLESEDYNGNRAEWSARSVRLEMKSLATDIAVETALADLQEAAQTAQGAADAAQLAAQAAQDDADQLALDQTASNEDIAAAQQRADEAFNNATSAATAAGNAQTSADSKNTNWLQPTAPAGTGHKVGDSWTDSDNGYRLLTWNGTAWITTQDSALAQATAEAKGRTYTQAMAPPVEARLPQNLWVDTSAGVNLAVTKFWDATAASGAGAWVAVKDAEINAAELRAAQDAKAKADAAASAAINAQAYSKNASFDDWSGALPASHLAFGTGPTKETSIYLTGPNAVRFNCTDTTTDRGLNFNGILDHAPNLEYFTVEVSVRLVSGTSFSGAGVVLDWIGMTPNRAVLSLNVEIPAPTLGKWYTVSKVLRRPSGATGTFTVMDGFLMANYSGSGPIGAKIAKDIIFDWLNIRPSTAEEILAYTAPTTQYVDQAEADAIAAADSAAQIKADAARDAAIADTTTKLLGKNKTVWSLNPATGTTGYTAGDTWFQRDGTGAVIAQWEFDTDWRSRVVSETVLAGISAGKIISGFISSERIDAASLSAKHVQIGDFTNLITNGTGDLGAGIGWGSPLIYDTVDKPSGVTGVFKTTAGQSTTAAGPTVFKVDPSTEYITDIWLKADLPNSRIYIELRDQAAAHGTTNILMSTGANQGIYPLQNFTVPTVWTKYSIKTTTTATATSLRVGNIFFNHTNGTERGATVSMAMSMRRRLGGSLLVDGAIDGKLITGPTIQTDAGATTGIKLTPTELAGYDGTNKNFSLTSGGALYLKGEIKSGSTIEGARITGTQGIETSVAPNTGVKMTNTGIKAYDAGNNMTFSVDATTGEVEAPGIKANSIKGDKIEASSITADKLLISRGANLFTDPMIRDSAGWANSPYFTATGGKNGGGSISLPMNAIQTGLYYAQAANLSTRRTLLVPGGTYRLAGWVKTSAAAPIGSLQLYLRIQNEGSTVGALASNVSGAIPSNQAETVPDTWTFVSGMVTVPESTTYTTGVLGAFKQSFYTTGTTVWSDLSIQQAMAGELIVDGAITTEHMTSGTIDAGVLSAGSITAPKIAAKTITTDKLVITSSDNLVVGGDMALSAASWQKSTYVTTNATAGRGGGATLRFTGSVAAQSSLNLSNRVTVEPDNKFRCSIFVKSTSALAIDRVRLMVRCFTTATAYTDVIGTYNTAALVANTWTQIQGVSAPLPANTIAVEFYLFVTNNATGTITDIDYVSVTRASDASLVVDGAITSKKLETELVLATKIVAGDPTGTHAEMSPQGFRVFADATEVGAPSTEVVRLGVADTNDYFAVTKSDGTLAATISQDGVGSFTQVNATDSFFYKGKEIYEILDAMPKGELYKAELSTDIDNITTKYGTVEAQFVIKGDRQIELSGGILFYPVATATEAYVEIHYTTDGTAPTINSPMLFNKALGMVSTAVFDQKTWVHTIRPVTFAGAPNTISYAWEGKTMRLLMTLHKGNGEKLMPRAGLSTYLYVRDTGKGIPHVPNFTPGGGSNPTPQPPAPAQQTYVKQYGAWNSMNYQGSNAQYNFDTGRMYQGLSPAGYGNLKSIALFPDMTADLSGATINYIRVYFNFTHWYYNSGGTARIGVHGHTGIPATFSHAGNVVNSGGWPKPGARWVDIPSAHWANFKSGAYRGVSLEGDSTYGTYGYADRPTIEISYTK